MSVVVNPNQPADKRSAVVALLSVVMLAAPLVMESEGVVTKTYVDPVGISTACVGETDHEVVSMRKIFTRDECVAVMGASLMMHAQKIEPCIKADVNRYQAAAVLSWSYNVGVAAACRSTLVRHLNAGKAFCDDFLSWVYAGGKRLPGLVTRRQRERALCLHG